MFKNMTTKRKPATFGGGSRWRRMNCEREHARMRRSTSKNCFYFILLLLLKIKEDNFTELKKDRFI